MILRLSGSPCTFQPDSDLKGAYSSLIPADSHDLTEATRAMAKRGSDDLKKLAALQAPLVRASRADDELLPC